MWPNQKSCVKSVGSEKGVITFVVMEYNTTRNYLTMREYGRHIQKMVEHVLTIEDEEHRQQQAHVVIELMAF